MPDGKKTLKKMKDPLWLSKAAMGLATLPVAGPGGLVGPLAELLKSDKDTKEVLAKLYHEAYSLALAEAAGDFGFEEAIAFPFPKEAAKKADFSSLDPDFPSMHPFFEVLNRQALEILIRDDQTHDRAGEIAARAREKFTPSLNHCHRIKPEQFDKAKKFFDLAIVTYGDKELKLRRHMKEVANHFAFMPLPLDKNVTLGQIYITPRATRRDIIIHSEKDAEGVEIDKADLLNGILIDLQRPTKPIVIHGQPGHGKTSSLRALSFVLSSGYGPSPSPFYLFYEIKSLENLHENEIQVLRRKTDFVDSDDFFTGKHVVLMLDGLDERQTEEGTDRNLGKFLRNIFDLARRVNQRTGSRLDLIVTGRSRFMHQVRDSFSSDYVEYEIKDFDEEHIRLWLNNYSQKRDLEPKLTLDLLEEKKLGELKSQPVLLTICAVLLADPAGRKLLDKDIKLKHEEKGGLSRRQVYQRIIEWSYIRCWQHGNKRKKTMDGLFNNVYQFQLFLQAVALEMLWQGVDEMEAEALIGRVYRNKDSHGLGSILPEDKGKARSALGALLVAFFFKSQDVSKISFIHKTIKDYLSIEAMLRRLKKAASKYDQDDRAGSISIMAELLYQTLGHAPISPEDHWGFIRDACREEKADLSFMVRNLLEVFDVCQDHRFLCKHGSVYSKNPVLIEANMISNTLCWLLEADRAQVEEMKILTSINSRNLFTDIIKLSKIFFLFYSNHLISFNNRNPEKFKLIDIPFNLEKTNLCYSQLFSVRIENAVFRYCKLVGADLSSMTIWFSDFSDADMSGASLYCANFSGSDVRRAKFRNSDLCETKFISTNLRGADFREAEFRSAKCNEAALNGADLRGADLSGSSFREVNFSDKDSFGRILNEVDFRGEKLRAANLSGANLSGVNLRLANLRGVDLRGVNLSGADLREAGLVNADLRHMQMKKTIWDEKTNWKGANLEGVKWPEGVTPPKP